MNKTFDEPYVLKRLHWIQKFTFFGFLVFLIWKSIKNGGQKNRFIVDIRKFNDLFIFNAYFFPAQSEIIGVCEKCIYITIIDAANFFYQ